jgi:hypothetical protein
MRLKLFVSDHCVICDLVRPVVESIAKARGYSLTIHGEAPEIPAYPALLVGKALFIGEGIPSKLNQIIQGENHE